MRTTVGPLDELLRRARARAAEERRSLTSLLVDGLRLRLAARPPACAPGPLPVSRRGGGLAPGIDPSRAQVTSGHRRRGELTCSSRMSTFCSPPSGGVIRTTHPPSAFSPQHTQVLQVLRSWADLALSSVLRLAKTRGSSPNPNDPADVLDDLGALLQPPARLLTGSPTTWWR